MKETWGNLAIYAVPCFTKVSLFLKLFSSNFFKNVLTYASSLIINFLFKMFNTQNTLLNSYRISFWNF